MYFPAPLFYLQSSGKDLSRTDTAFEMPSWGPVIEFPALDGEGTIIYGSHLL